jgi:hypothetical protein
MRHLMLIVISLLVAVFSDNASLPLYEKLVSRLPITSSTGDNECTIMVISGRATTDGRPILWKNRDVTRADQKYCYIPAREDEYGTTYGFISNFYADNPYRCYMGVNEVGLAVIDANCYNLTDNRKDGLDDGDIMRLALERCENINDWEQLLNVTSMFGRKDPQLYGVMDASGAAKLYECGNTNYTVYDANDPDDAPDGLIVRSVFAFSGWYPDQGLQRYNRARLLVDDRLAEGPFDPSYILRVMSRDFSLACQHNSPNDPYPLPYYGHQGNHPVGFVNTSETINRYKTRSCSVIRGVLPDEDPRLTTTYAILGQPVLSIAIPLWVASESMPSFLSTGEHAPWYSVIEERMNSLYPLPGDTGALYMDTHYLVDSTKTGVFTWTLAKERWAIEQAEEYLDQWRQEGFSVLDIRQAQNQIAQSIWQCFSNEGDTSARLQITDSDVPIMYKIKHINYPNPFNLSTTISFNIEEMNPPDKIIVNVYTILGTRVANLGEVKIVNGYGSVRWDGRDDRGNQVAAGIYLYRAEAPGINETGKMLLLK